MHYALLQPGHQGRAGLFGNSRQFARCSLVDQSVGSVHMGLGLCELRAGGYVDVHVHSFEESFYVLEGAPTLIIDARAYQLGPGACGLVPLGTPHAWVAPAHGTARWIDMLAPQPRARKRAGGHVLPRPGRHLRTPRLRHPRSAVASPVSGHRRRHRAGPPEGRRRGGCAHRVREHEHGAAGVQRHRAEDAGRSASRRRAVDDVHGRVPAGRSRAPARSPAGGVVLHSRRRDRGGCGRSPVSASRRRRVLDRRRLHSRVPQHQPASPCGGSRHSLRSCRHATAIVSIGTGSIWRTSSPAAIRAENGRTARGIVASACTLSATPDPAAVDSPSHWSNVCSRRVELTRLRSTLRARRRRPRNHA